MYVASFNASRSRLTSFSERAEQGLHRLDGGRTREHSTQSLHPITPTPINIIAVTIHHHLMLWSCDSHMTTMLLDTCTSYSAIYSRSGCSQLTNQKLLFFESLAYLYL